MEHEGAAKRQVIKAMLYYRDNRTLMIWYTAGGIYLYYDVSEYLYRLIRLNEDDPWPVLNRLVRSHPFKRVTEKAVAKRIPKTAYFPGSASKESEDARV